MSSMKKTKEGINLKKLLRLKNTGSIFVIAGLLMIFVIASYTYILQSSYTKTALETEITRDTASADAVHKLVDGLTNLNKIAESRFALLFLMVTFMSLVLFPFQPYNRVMARKLSERRS